ncbi:MAG: NAD-dependent epimerase/dehydratase family protein [Solirubrobacterales bacterium]
MGSLRNIEHIRAGGSSSATSTSTEPVEIEEQVDFVLNTSASAPASRSTTRGCRCIIARRLYGTHHMLGVAKFKRARFLLASTSEVYGRSIRSRRATGGQCELDVAPAASTTRAKRYAEALTMAYHRQQGVDTAIVRIFNTYGYGCAPTTAARS